MGFENSLLFDLFQMLGCEIWALYRLTPLALDITTAEIYQSVTPLGFENSLVFDLFQMLGCEICALL